MQIDSKKTIVYFGVFYLVTILLTVSVDTMQVSFLLFSVATSLFLVRQLKHIATYNKVFSIIAYTKVFLCVVEFSYFIYRITSSGHVYNNYWIFGAFLLANILNLVALIQLTIQITAKWNKLQLLLDIAFFSFVILFAIKDVIIAQVVGSANSVGFTLYLITFFTVDTIMMTMIITLFVANSQLRRSSFVQLLALGFITYLLTDLMFAIDYYIDAQEQLAKIANVFTLSSSYAFILAIQTYKAKTIDNQLSDLKNIRVRNFGAIRIVYFTIFMPVVLYVYQVIVFRDVVVFLVAIAVYLVSSFSYQRVVIADELFEQELRLQTQLEDRVHEKTKQLKYANMTIDIQAKTDDLTGLNNRNFFFQYVEDLISYPQSAFAILYLDLNNFKSVNDLHGHQMGDEVLIDLSKRFNACTAYDFTVCRIGGDEFTIVYDGVDKKTLIALSQLIVEIVNQPFQVRGYLFNIGVSIGIARYPEDAKTVDELLTYADAAMYYAKSKEVSDSYYMYSNEIFRRIDRKNRIEMLLRSADIARDFKLFYQPLVRASDGQVIACEALLRWEHVDEGFISPAEFIPIAEEIGLIYPLSNWVFKTAISQLNVWNERYDSQLQVGINLSPRLFSYRSFFPELKQIIAETGINPANLDVEITEHSAMSSSTFMEEIFMAFADLGVHVSIDDFGTGYASLSYIKRFDINTIKIAKELIDKIEISENDRIIVKAIVLMAHGLGLTTVAEGVETNSQLSILRDLECDIIQGYIYGRPVNSATFEAAHLKTMGEIV